MYGIAEEVEKRQCIDESYTHVVVERSGGTMEGTIGRIGLLLRLRGGKIAVHETRNDQQDTFVAAANWFIHPRPSCTRPKPKETPGNPWFKWQWLWAIAS